MKKGILFTLLGCSALLFSSVVTVNLQKPETVVADGETETMPLITIERFQNGGHWNNSEGDVQKYDDYFGGYYLDAPIAKGQTFVITMNGKQVLKSEMKIDGNDTTVDASESGDTYNSIVDSGFDASNALKLNRSANTIRVWYHPQRDKKFEICFRASDEGSRHPKRVVIQRDSDKSGNQIATGWSETPDLGYRISLDGLKRDDLFGWDNQENSAAIDNNKNIATGLDVVNLQNSIGVNYLGWNWHQFKGEALKNFDKFDVDVTYYPYGLDQTGRKMAVSLRNLYRSGDETAYPYEPHLTGSSFFSDNGDASWSYSSKFKMEKLSGYEYRLVLDMPSGSGMRIYPISGGYSDAPAQSLGYLDGILWTGGSRYIVTLNTAMSGDSGVHVDKISAKTFGKLTFAEGFDDNNNVNKVYGTKLYYASVLKNEYLLSGDKVGFYMATKANLDKYGYNTLKEAVNDGKVNNGSGGFVLEQSTTDLTQLESCDSQASNDSWNTNNKIWSSYLNVPATRWGSDIVVLPFINNHGITTFLEEKTYSVNSIANTYKELTDNDVASSHADSLSVLSGTAVEGITAE